MGWDTVPWFVENGAQHSASLARKLAFAAMRGNEGIVGGPDLEVRALAVPGTKIRVFPGLAAIRNRTPGAMKEMYLASMISEEEVDIAATSASGPRSDMICVRIENPWIDGEPWPDPPSTPLGPYVKTLVISNVGSAAVTPPPGNGNALIPLARIDLPASTATVIQSYITDLRFMASVLEQSNRIMVAVPGQHMLAVAQTTYVVWPSPPMSTQTIKVPEWATKCVINGTVAVVNFPTGNSVGDLRAGLGTLRTAAMKFDYSNSAAGPDRGNLIFGGTVDIPATMRGTTQNVVTEARSAGAGGGATVPIYAELYSTVSLELKFQAQPTSNT